MIAVFRLTLVALSTLVALAQTAAPGTAEKPAAAPSRAAEYILRVGDEIEIRAFNIPDLNQLARVRPDGKISLLLLNEVEVAGKTPAELSDLLNSLYARHFRTPRITAIVRSFSNFQVSVGGEVVHPGSIPLGGNLTLTTAIFQAGGFKEEDGPRKVTLLRSGQAPAEIDVREILSRSRPDVPLQPGDIVFVAKTTISVYVAGEVNEPGLIPLTGRLTATSAIFRAKGAKNTGRLRDVILIRDSGGQRPTISKLDIQAVIGRGAPDIELKPFDIVFVPKSKIAKLNQFMDQYFRQLLPLSVSAGFSYLLGAKVF